MKKVVIKIAILSIIFLMLLMVEHVVEDKNEMEEVSVYLTAMPIEVGTQIQNNMLREVMIPKHLLSEYIIRENIEGYMLLSVGEGEFLYEHQISDVSPLKLNETQRMITIKCSIIESNGWIFQINDIVDIVMVHNDEKTVIENAVVSRVFDETLGNEAIPEYVSVLVSEEDAMKYFQKVFNSKIFISHKSQEGL
ncbi:MAG: hypothetical protein JEZ08_14140 [Clostridiales bacterium]|nr:hypothetical protein [Clostridiales bacterium]